jgi:hypothetical protein
MQTVVPADAIVAVDVLFEGERVLALRTEINPDGHRGALRPGCENKSNYPENGTGCPTVSIAVQLNQQKPLMKKLDFECGD